MNHRLEIERPCAGAEAREQYGEEPRVAIVIALREHDRDDDEERDGIEAQDVQRRETYAVIGATAVSNGITGASSWSAAS